MRNQYCSNQLQVLSNESNEIIIVYLHVKGVKLELALRQTSQFFAPYGHLILMATSVWMTCKFLWGFKVWNREAAARKLPPTHTSPAYSGFLVTEKKMYKKKGPVNTPHPPEVYHKSQLSKQEVFYCNDHTPLLIQRWLRQQDVMPFGRKWQGGGRGLCECSSLDFFCMVEFPRRGDPWQGHSPSKEGGRKPQAGVMLPKKGLQVTDMRFTARTMKGAVQ